jgi:hypothetical protein
MTVKLDPIIKKRLAAIQDMWAAAEPAQGFAELPVGQYRGKILSAVIELSKKDRLQLVWSIKVTKGDHKGTEVKRFSGLETDKNLAWLKGDFAILGVEVDGDDSNAIAEAGAEVEDLEIIFNVRTKEEYTNIDFVDVVKDGADEDGDEPEKPKKGKDKDADEDKETEKGSKSGKLPTKMDIRGMTGKKLRLLAKDLEIDPDKYDDDDRKIQTAIIKELDLA